MNLYGATQGGTLTTRRNASLASLALSEKPESIAAGVAGANCCGRHLGLEADRWVRAHAAAILWRAEHRRDTECAGVLAPDTAG